MTIRGHRPATQVKKLRYNCCNGFASVITSVPNAVQRDPLAWSTVSN